MKDQEKKKEKKTRKLVGFYLTSNIHIYYEFCNHISTFSCHLCTPCLADIFLFPYLCQ